MTYAPYQSTMCAQCNLVWRQRIQTVWDELDQRIIIDKAVKQWRTHLRACIEAKGDHFERKL